MMLLKLKKEAIEDLRYLLSRGYDRSHAIKFIGDRYLLNKEQRLLLYRAVYSQEISYIHKSKLVFPEEIKGNKLLIDGFNVIWTVFSAIKGRPVFLCDDGIVRDISGIHGSIINEEIFSELKLIVSNIVQLIPSETIFFFEKQISKSGEIAKIIRILLKENNLFGDAKVVTSPDYELTFLDGIVSTSDSIIIEKVKKIFDLAAYIINKLNIRPLTLSDISV
ncbi:MAG: DUF434 domain-containing protein [Candidatus Methanomethylicaceae archaeon]